VDAARLPAKQAAAAIERVVQRYGRVLDMTREDLQLALQGSAQGEATLEQADEPPAADDAGPAR
jgi:hypothetical protein